ncbi:MAG TPA: hypothetical protein VFB62_11565, partial [Polyangiaceae bacterium]|nr:hypothetical protein [Polyangiaceae bacterium]
MSDERPNAPEDESAEPQPEKAPAFPEVEPKERKGEKAEAPKTEEPKTEEPKAKEPKSEKPLAEKPKGEKPKDEKEDDWAPRPIVGTRAAWGLVVLSAILCPVGFVGIGVWPVAFVAWVPLIIALRGQSPRRALAFGWVAGFAMTMVGFYWLVSMLETFSGFPLVLCVLFAAVLCIQKGGRIGLMALLYAYATRKRWHHGLAFLAAFAVSELVYPLLFPWYYGASVHGVPILMQTAELGGPIAVSIVILAVNVAV